MVGRVDDSGKKLTNTTESLATGTAREDRNIWNIQRQWYVNANGSLEHEPVSEWTPEELSSGIVPSGTYGVSIYGTVLLLRCANRSQCL